MEFLNETKPQNKSVTINIYEDKRCYRKADLTKEEVEYRLKHEYHESEQWDIETHKCETYLLKPRFNESDSHLFLIYRIADYLRKFTNKIWLFETGKPDIIFIVKGKKIAIEVETGDVLKKVPDELHAKIWKLNKKFDNWFFVVTKKDQYWNYRKLGNTCTRKNVVKMINKYLKEDKNGNQ